MTFEVHHPERLMCEWCGSDFERSHRHGPVPRFCGAGCRQRTKERRQLRAAMGMLTTDRDRIEAALRVLFPWEDPVR